ncbi:hypothetical protein SAICODRAFT_10137 [Saitoella complicata NRRL Y-17804]|uniref:uncharacterized protein n=1 Tax=Saitoella complicata (strain BCRC 22490 / CBS 7301 / JCM 7358 / NBRC 10748 / NRRL Y-17804) TaxID=698492 RepID=UPI00086725D3|nr:uncharacterized protein SAICODRAFT_10137 [Saitoella complicata NRRL Y-17804]ODQ50078.1 hypothetical protein SAICODRAFT_10137 [Saitoella complicata NRRL Y-17804]
MFTRSLNYRQRSRLTASLFGTTALLAFLVVAAPSILPCPARKVQRTGFRGVKGEGAEMEGKRVVVLEREGDENIMVTHVSI